MTSTKSLIQAAAAIKIDGSGTPGGSGTGTGGGYGEPNRALTIFLNCPSILLPSASGQWLLARSFDGAPEPLQSHVRVSVELEATVCPPATAPIMVVIHSICRR